jgi:hypothetical protein
MVRVIARLKTKGLVNVYYVIAHQFNISKERKEVN